MNKKTKGETAWAVADRTRGQRPCGCPADVHGAKPPGPYGCCCGLNNRGRRGLSGRRTGNEVGVGLCALRHAEEGVAHAARHLPRGPAWQTHAVCGDGWNPSSHGTRMRVMPVATQEGQRASCRRPSPAALLIYAQVRHTVRVGQLSSTRRSPSAGYPVTPSSG